jgi:hypothetical protein
MNNNQEKKLWYNKNITNIKKYFEKTMNFLYFFYYSYYLYLKNGII